MREPVFVSQESLAQSRAAALRLREALKGRLLRYYIESYGCQMNDHDSEKLAGMLCEAGFQPAPSKEEADFILFNTCCIREHAEKRVFGNVGALKKQKDENPALCIAVCGCMMQQKDVAARLYKRFPFVDMIFGTNELHRFPILLEEALSGKRVLSVTQSDGEIAEGLPVLRESRFSTNVTIMYGCDNFCTYCIVPYVRGRERSRRPEAVRAELEELVRQGYKDITLLGQNVNSYGRGCDFDCDFADLLRMLSQVPGDFVLRFMTSHPKDASEKLFATMAECDKVAKHLHLPFQSGSSRVLKAMNRSYDREQYLAQVALARRYMPSLSLTSDVIVGFPNETEEEFQQTISLVEQVEFDNLFTFIYSRREGTVAARIEDHTPMEEKKRRFEQLLQVQNQISNRRNAACVGQTMRVLVDGLGDDPEYPLTARTQGQKLVRLKGDPALVGRFVEAKIEKHTTWALFGAVQAQ